jgi:phage terminase small subunit
VKEFSEREAALVELLADLGDKQTKEQKAKAAGYHPKTVYRLLRRPEIREAIQTRVRQNLGVDLARVFAVLVEAAVSGNIKAAELLLKAAGYIQAPTQSNTVNVSPTSDEGFADRLRDRFAERVEQWRVGKGVPNSKDEE